ncbi:urease accessory protein UreF [Sulfitobacter aestuariivivens]|uniref:Urease accessory protein UreF n=1 Tax=Sulfitobacter aestuariivivens TaxID=2766981 RepID=A0A927D5P5_9RHOB|nr:urease accessory UreF family protein [Sulfitobacter aestuariivivens]MBD3663932.1 urease accessory protein UreF [Sulfitobacter aestuariivivens]
MNTEQDILTMAQWFSPSFPVGAFAYSHGLETAIQSGAIVTASDLQCWLSDVLIHGSGRNDCILLRAAYASTSDTERALIHETALAVAASAERLLETQLQGAAFCDTTAKVWDMDGQHLCYPVAVGAAAAQMQFDVDLVAMLYLHSFAGNLVSAAVRAVPLGQTDGQSVLAALTPLCDQIAGASRLASLDDLNSTAFLSDIAAMKHETLQPRIFRS